MRKAILLGFVVIAAGGFMLGYLAHRNDWLPQSLRRASANIFRAADATPAPASLPTGDWFPYESRDGAPTLQESAAEELNALGYLAASEPAPARDGVTVNDPAACDGFNLYISGHKPEAVLMDMNGKAVHRWSNDFNSLWPNYEPPPYYRVTGHLNWRRVYLFPNGDLLALHDAIGLIKLDKDSRLIWASRQGNHHDFAVIPEGDIFALTREFAKVEWFRPEKEILDPSITILDSGGVPKSKISLLESFRGSDYASILSRVPNLADVFHTNTIEVFDGRHAAVSPLFRKGNVLVSIHAIDTIAIIDPDIPRVEWAMTGLWRGQHEPTLLENGHMLVFDNYGRPSASRILEFEPLGQRVVWTYGEREDEHFYTEFCGAVHRLPNGNTLITETKNGRAFEVTPEGKTVWEFVNPNLLDVEGVTMIASLFEMIRIPTQYAAGWLDATPPAVQ